MAKERATLVVSKEELIQAIEGSKRAAIIRGYTEYEPRQELVLATHDDKQKAQTTTQSVTLKCYGDLVWEDALDCGFGNLEQFRAYLNDRYEELSDDNLMTIVRF